MTSNKLNNVVAKRVVQNNQEFLIGTFKIRQVRNFTKYTSHLIVGYDEVGDDDRVYEDVNQIIPRYNPEIQRKTNNAKVDSIVDFLLHDPMAMFPTNIVISIPTQVIDNFEELENDYVSIELNPIVKEELEKKHGDVFLTIIDGQHRIKGIEKAIEVLELEISNLSKILLTSDNKELHQQRETKSKLMERLMNFELIVSFFIDPTLEYQAMIFATINKTQTRVPENLVYSLFGLTKNDSPQKSSLEIVLALNGIEKSPFSNRVKLVGGKYQRGAKIPLSQATMVKSVLFNICNNSRESEIDRFKERVKLKVNPKNLIFRKYYAYNEDHKIVRVMYAFYSAVRDTFINNSGDSYWNLVPREGISNILQTNVGYQALLKVLIDLIKVTPEEERDQKDKYAIYLQKAVSIDFEDAGDEKRYPFTSKSINLLYEDIMKKISL